MDTTNFLINIRRLMKLHEGIMKEICAEYQLSLIEANIISFLHNNPACDTACDIVELRMLSKGNVSKALESLICKGFVTRTPDCKDRRKMHLSLLPKTIPVTDSIDTAREQIQELLFSGFTEEECKLFDSLHRRMMENAEKADKRRKFHERK